VADAAESIFQPAVYSVSGVQVLAGDLAAAEIGRIISYEGRYRDIAGAGEQIEARGKLEYVDGLPRQLVIGTTQLKGEEYLKPVP
jgi:predicted nucleotidyltransferase